MTTRHDDGPMGPAEALDALNALEERIPEAVMALMSSYIVVHDPEDIQGIRMRIDSLLDYVHPLAPPDGGRSRVERRMEALGRILGKAEQVFRMWMEMMRPGPGPSAAPWTEAQPATPPDADWDGADAGQPSKGSDGGPHEG